MRLFACPILRSGKRAEHVTAHKLLKEVITQVYGIELPKIAPDDHGKPFFPEVPTIHFNLSHCHTLALCGVSDSPIGVDAELIRPLRGNVLSRSFSQRERQLVKQSENSNETFFRLWTLKESYVKALGVGITYPMQKVNFHLERDCITEQPNGYQFGQFLYQDHVISYAIGVDDTHPLAVEPIEGID
jgi:4'-phosphopantetheinyl transferase